MNPESFRIDSPTPHQAAEEATRYYDILLAAFERGGTIYTPREFQEDVANGDLLLIRMWNEGELLAVACCRVQNTYRGRELYAIAAAGTGADQWGAEMMQTFEQVGREAECTAVVCDARQGWTKMLKGEGYRVFQVRMRKQL